MCWILFICKGSKSFNKSINQSGSPDKKEHLLICNSKTTQNLNIYLHNYQTETTIFLATKHEKTIIMACSYSNVSIQKIHQKQQKMVASVANGLGKMSLRLFQSTSVVTNMGPMLLRQIRRLTKGHCWRYSNSLKELANVIAKSMKKNIFCSLLPAYWRYKPGFYFFPDNRNGKSTTCRINF